MLSGYAKLKPAFLTRSGAFKGNIEAVTREVLSLGGWHKAFTPSSASPVATGLLQQAYETTYDDHERKTRQATRFYSQTATDISHASVPD